MPPESKFQKTRRLNYLSGREIRNDKIQGNYVCNNDVYSFY